VYLKPVYEEYISQDVDNSMRRFLALTRFFRFSYSEKLVEDSREKSFFLYRMAIHKYKKLTVLNRYTYNCNIAEALYNCIYHL